MCGIAGLVRGTSRDEVAVSRMNDRLRHRGPDAAAVRSWPDHGVTLGHRRLAIIDLSPLGVNPMSNEDGTVWIVFNGEIYNFQELRRDLEERGHVFRSHTDTEVIVHAYEEWGDDHVDRLRGMFAYAIYDRRAARSAGPGPGGFRLLLVRDRLGIKPLYYYERGGTFAFASEIKSILACDGIDRTLDWTALFDFLTYLYVPAPKSAYAHIRKLPPGHRLVFEQGRTTVEQYWDLQPHRGSGPGNADEAARQLRTTLEQIVRLHLVSDVPLGVLLSGGIDSGAITALSSRASQARLSTFSVGFDVAAHSELPYAALVAERYATDHHPRVIGRESVDRMLPRVLGMYDEPFADTSAIPTYHVVAVAGEQVKVLLSGDGGDEVFAGYNWYRSWLARAPIDRLPVAIRERLLGPLAHRWPRTLRGKKLIGDLSRSPIGRYALLMELFSPQQKRELLSPERRREFADYDDYWLFRTFWRDDLDPVTRLQYLDLKTFLPDDVLTKVDRASMASSVEVRPPLLDHELVEQAFGLPSAWRWNGDEQKWLLKRAMDGLLPDAILGRAKKGFSAPMTPWLAESRSWVRSELAEAGRRAQGTWLAPDLPERSDQFARGTQVWGLLVLQRWLASEVSGEPLPGLDEEAEHPAPAFAAHRLS